MSPSFVQWNESVSQGLPYVSNGSVDPYAKMQFVTNFIIIFAILLFIIALIGLIVILTKKRQRGNGKDGKNDAQDTIRVETSPIIEK